MVLDLRDIIQQGIGSIAFMIWIFVLRESPLVINPKTGLIWGIFWLIFLYNPLIKKTTEQNQHFALSVVMSVVLSSILALHFGFVEMEIFKGFAFFGSLAWIAGIFFGVAGAIIFDQKNVSNPLNKFFIRRK